MEHLLYADEPHSPPRMMSSVPKVKEKEKEKVKPKPKPTGSCAITPKKHPP